MTRAAPGPTLLSRRRAIAKHSSTTSSRRPDTYFGLRVDYSSLMAQQLIGPGARMGLNMNGVIVRDLEPNSRAEAAFRQLTIGQGRWLITKVNGTPVANPPAFHAAAKKSQTYRLTVVNAMDYAGTERTIALP